MINKNSKIFVTGHNGMVGSSIIRILKKKGFKKIITASKSKLNLLNQNKVKNFLKKNKPDCVILTAAKVGGILSNNNDKPKFIYENITIQSNIIHFSHIYNVKNLLFLGSSCVYPKNCKQPIKEEYLLSNYLEQTNDAYAVAKIAGIKMCEAYSKKFGLNYFCLMPSNMFGPNDNYDLNNSHFFAALLKKIYLAKKNKKKIVTIWGDGRSKRELLFVDHFSESCLHFLTKKKQLGGKIINIGSHIEMTIKNYAKYIMKKIDADLELKFDLSKPNGVVRKKLDLNYAKSLGWNKKFDFDQAFDFTLKDFEKNELN